MIDFWVSVSDNAANWVVAATMVIQTVLFFIAFKLGFQYLDQHREKVKEEQKQSIIIDCLKKIMKLRSDSVNYYSIYFTNSFNENDPRELEEQVDSVIKRHRQQSSYTKTIEELFFEISAMIRILNKPELDDQIKRIGMIFNHLDHKYRSIFEHASDNSPEKAYKIIKELIFSGSSEDPKNIFNLLIKALNLFSEDLLTSYHSKES